MILEYPCAPTIERLSHARVAGCNLLYVHGKTSEKKSHNPHLKRMGKIPQTIPILHPWEFLHISMFSIIIPMFYGCINLRRAFIPRFPRCQDPGTIFTSAFASAAEDNTADFIVIWHSESRPSQRERVWDNKCLRMFMLCDY